MKPPCRCGKRSFATQAEADTVLGRIWAQCKPGGRRLECRAYQCDEGWWHLTSKPRPASTGAA